MNVEKTRPVHGGHGERGITVLLRAMHEAVAVEATAQERLDQLTTVIASHIVAEVCSIYLRRADDELELYSTEGLNREAVHTTRLKWGEGLVGVVAATQRPLVTADAPLHPAFAYRPETGEDPLHSFLGVPLIRSGKSLGVLVLQNKASRRYMDDEVEAAQAVATLLAEIAASGELLDEDETEAVDEMLHRPERMQAIAIVPRIAMGRAAFHEAPTPKHKVFAKDVAHEAERLESGLDQLRASVDEMLARDGLGGAPREVLETYRLFAYDRGWKERLRAAVFSGLTAESAVEQVQSENRARLGGARDPYLRERMHDLDDLAHRLQRHLTGEVRSNPRDLASDSIVIARVMGPADLLEYNRENLKGVILSEASATSHVAIVARALEIPLVSGVDASLDWADEGDEIIIDGHTGEIHIRPTEDIVESYKQKRELQSERQAAYAKERNLPSVTIDGAKIDILMNAGLALDMPHLHETGAAGIGLFRTELQFLIGAQLPRVSVQEAFYREVLKQADDKPVVFRTADLGGDKSASYMKRRHEANPAMGWRGMRMAADRPGIIRPQLRALIGAAEGRELSILFPLITLASEIDIARSFVDREVAYLKKRGRNLPEKILLGAMVETPAAAWQIEHIAARVDFLSVGGNDLAQFYFASDRDSDLMRERFDPLDAGFLRFLKRLVERAEAAGKPLTYCGEQAADGEMAAALIGIGVRRISIPGTSVGPFRRLVRSIDANAVSKWLDDKITTADGAIRREFSSMLRQSEVEVGSRD